MKIEEKLKVILVILVIILVSLISFGGIYIQKMKFVENIIPDYQLGMDLKGGRIIGLVVDNSKNTVIYDKDGKVVDKEGEGTTKKEEPVNPEENKTEENYKKSKKILEKRLSEMNVSDYMIRLDEKTGKMYIQIPENMNTDLVAQYLTIRGTFTVVNEAGDVLLNNSHLKKAQVGYNTTSNGTTVYLTINLNEEGTEKFKNITNEYKTTTDDEGKETSKKVTLKIDETTLLETSFDDEISNGTIQMSIGASSNDGSSIQEYIKEASNIAVLLNGGEIPLTYNNEENRFVMTDATQDMLVTIVVAVGVICLVGIIILIIKYKKVGFLASIALVGYIATLLVVLRYTNVVLTVEGITGIIISIIMNYIFTIYLLNFKNMKTIQAFKEALIKTTFIFIPVAIMAVTLCFAGWSPTYSFGMVTFWGLLLTVLYNLIITRTLIVNTKTKNNI